MTIPILYTFRRCPYAMRARMVLRYSQVECEQREVLLKDKPAEMLAASVKGTVPVLVLADGSVLDESIDLMHWALSRHDPDQWLAVDKDEALVKRNDDYFKYYLDRYKYFDRYPQFDQQYYLHKALMYLQELEAMLELQPVGGFLFGKQTTWADVAIFPFIRQFAFVDKSVFDMLPLPKLQKWLDYFLNSILFESVMQKQAVWKSTHIAESAVVEVS